MKTVTVIPLKKGVFSDNLTYFTSKEVKNGDIVTVSIRKKKILGLVIYVENVTDTKINIKDLSFDLKKVEEVKDRSIFRPEYLESALMLSDYFVSQKSSVVASLLPAIFLEKYDKINQNLTLPEIPVQKENKLKTEKLLLQLPLIDRILIYKTLIRENFALKKSVFLVLPTEQDIKIFQESLSKGIEQFTFAIKSGSQTKKTLAEITSAINSVHPVLILGTAPFLAVPRNDIGVIILEHESSNAYRTFTKLKLDWRVFAELFASKINAKLILGDTLLRLETLARQDLDGFHPLYPLSFRIDFGGEIEVLSPNSSEDKKFKILADQTVTEIKETLDKGKNVFIFSLRKGLATMTICKDCGEMVACQTCRAPVVLYTSKDGKKRMLVCNKCKTELDADTKCEHCGSWNLLPLGVGTDTVVEYLKDLQKDEGKLKKTKIFKLDKESAVSAKGAEQIVEEFANTKGAILIGTEMAFFYIKEKISLAVIASFDSLYSIPSFRMSEKILQLIIAITNKAEKKIIIQTKNLEDPALIAVQNGNLLSFIREEIKDREKLEYPPFKRFIKITHLGDKIKTQKAKEILTEIFKEYSPLIFSGFHAKLKDKYVTNALIKVDPKKWSYRELSSNAEIDMNLLAKLASLPPAFTVSVDPEDLL